MTIRHRIVAVLACHNRQRETLGCLAALFGQELPVDTQIGAILVDDGSQDGTAAAVEAAFPEVRLLCGDGTLWWGGAMALGLREAATTDADLHLWLNDDVRLDRDALSVLLGAWDGRGIVVGATRDGPDGGISYGGQRRTGRHPLKLCPVLPDGAGASCDTFQGNVVLVPAAVTRALGGIGAEFIGLQGMADTDFGLRARAAGVPIRLAPRSVGICRRNRSIAPWRDRRLGLRQRLTALFGPRGFPPGPFLRLMRRHGGSLWPLWAASAWGHALLGALRPPASPPYRLAVLEGVIPRYRLAQLQGLADLPDLRVTVYLGQGLAGWTAGSVPVAAVPLPTVPVSNRFWPFGGGRRMWTGGTLSALAGRADAVLMGLHTHDLAVWLAWSSRRIRGRPRLLLSGHFGLDAAPQGRETLHHRPRRRLRIFLARGADAVLPYTQQGADTCRRYGIPRTRIHVTHNSVDTAAIRAAAASSPAENGAAVRARYGLPAGALFLALGRLYPAKRFDLAIEAVAALRAAGRDCGLLVVGDGPARSRLEAAARNDSGIRFAGALFEETELAPLFQQATALVLPGSAGLAVLHAFAYGVPVIACAGLRHGPEIAHVEDGRNGLMIGAANANVLAAGMARLLDDEPLRMQLSAGAHATADTMSAATWAHAIRDAMAAVYEAHHD